MYNREQDLMNRLVGKTVKAIYMDEQNLTFETDEGDIAFGVEGDCCSTSVFYDFYGVKKLLENGKIIKVDSVELTVDDKEDKKACNDSIEVYGFAIVTENETFGEQTSVFSFRNYSNGYYGGSLTIDSPRKDHPVFDDVIETVSA